MSNWNKIFKPIVVLCAICVVITGALAAAALDAEVYENWTDVSGILMADPRIVENPQAIPEVTYDELRELSYSGAQVLHEDAIFPVREKNIPLNIRNTNAPDDPGTIIQERFEEGHDPDRFITGITGMKDFSIISLSKKGMSNQVGVLHKVLTVLVRHNISVDYVPNGIDNVSVVIPTDALAAKVIRMNAEIEAKEKRVQELEEAVKTMKANERTRRIEAAKAAVNAKFKDMNAVREECFDNELAEKVCQMCNEGKFCEDEDDHGQWCGDKKAVNALMALCMEAQAEMDKQAAAKKTHVFNAWSEAKGDHGDHGVDSVDKMLAFLGE